MLRDANGTARPVTRIEAIFASICVLIGAVASLSAINNNIQASARQALMDHDQNLTFRILTQARLDRYDADRNAEVLAQQRRDAREQAFQSDVLVKMGKLDALFAWVYEAKGGIKDNQKNGL